jgi:CDP-diacylglycerol---glycerol-3-phosphate 3-phosphatidyltransferase
MDSKVNILQKKILIPTLISSLRIAVIPFFIYLYNQENLIGCLILFSFAASTDLLDGFVARKLKVTSTIGAYYDALTDFILIIGIFTFFFAKSYYPIWLLILIIASFAQFLATGRYVKKLYDPIGRYVGSALYIGIVLTLLFPTQAIFYFVQFAYVVLFLISLISRIVSIAKNQKKKS